MIRLAIAILAVVATNAQVYRKHEFSDEKTPYDYVKDKLDRLEIDEKSKLPLSSAYEVEENLDYPDKLEQSGTHVVNNVGRLGLQGYGGYGPIGLGQNLGLGIGGLGLQGVGGGLQGVGGIQQQGVGVGNIGNFGNLQQLQQHNLALQNGGLGYINPAIGGLGIGGLALGHGGLLYHNPYLTQIGGGYVDKKAFDAAEKKGADENLEKIEKQSEAVYKQGQEGYQQSSAANVGENSDSNYYNDEEAKKKAADDEKYYEGAQKYDKQGANEENHKKAKSHKKGHVSKGFKSSSIKNQEEKSESFYDEAHDEGDHKIVGQNADSYGQKGQEGYKGTHEEKLFDNNEHGKKGHNISAKKYDDAKSNKGDYLHKDYKGGAEQLEKFNNLGAQSVHGHQEASGGFQQSKGVLPFHR